MPSISIAELKDFVLKITDGLEALTHSFSFLQKTIEEEHGPPEQMVAGPAIETYFDYLLDGAAIKLHSSDSILAVAVHKELVPQILALCVQQIDNCNRLMGEVCHDSIPQGGTSRGPSILRLLNAFEVLALCLFPTNYALWHARKRRILRLEPPEADDSGLYHYYYDYLLTSLVLSKHHKAGEVWEHRGWLAQARPAAGGPEQGPSQTRIKINDAHSLWLIATSAGHHPRAYPLWFGFVLPTARDMPLNSMILLVRALVNSYYRSHTFDISCLECICSLIERGWQRTNCAATNKHEPGARGHLIVILVTMMCLNRRCIINATTQFFRRARLVNDMKTSSAHILDPPRRRRCHADDHESTFLPTFFVAEGLWGVRQRLYALLADYGLLRPPLLLQCLCEDWELMHCILDECNDPARKGLTDEQVEQVLLPMTRFVLFSHKRFKVYNLF